MGQLVVDPLIHISVELAKMPISGLAADYPDGHLIQEHQHVRAQFLYAVQGVMVIDAQEGRWVVPPSRGVWLQPGRPHTVRMCGQVKMRTIFVDEDAAPGLPARNCVLDVSPLLRELILEASRIPLVYAQDSRDGRLMRLLLDELRELPVLPFYLPWPEEPRLLLVCRHLEASPDDDRDANAWAKQLAMSVKTFHRLFRRHTGISFGQWRQFARLLGSLEGLAAGEPVVQVALQHGYASQSAYAAVFRRHFGVTPREFYRSKDSADEAD
jgi:AraC-like DNA-binding protein